MKYHNRFTELEYKALGIEFIEDVVIDTRDNATKIIEELIEKEKKRCTPTEE
jgi:hypothetical protein